MWSAWCCRPLDIDTLIDHFVRKYSEVNGVPERPVSAATRARLRRHSWPGNVRELENAIHRAVLLTRGPEIEAETTFFTSKIPVPARPEAEGSAADAQLDERGFANGLVGRTVAEVERDLIIETLNHCLGNRTHAANILGISIRTLRNKLKQYSQEGIQVPTPREMDRAHM